MTMAVSWRRDNAIEPFDQNMKTSPTWHCPLRASCAAFQKANGG
jgi:hypothetical protein